MAPFNEKYEELFDLVLFDFAIHREQVQRDGIGPNIKQRVVPDV